MAIKYKKDEDDKEMLLTMKEIEAFTGMAAITLRRLIYDHGFPANNTVGTWVSHKKAINDWWYKHACQGAVSVPKRETAGRPPLSRKKNSKKKAK